MQFDVALLRPKRAQQPLVALLKQALAPTPVDEAQCFYSLQARIRPAGACCRGDVILVQSTLGANTLMAAVVWLHASEHGVCVTLCNKLRPVPGAGEQRWDGSERRVILVDTEDVLATCAHTDVRDGNIRIIMPWHLRRWAVADQ